MVRFYRHTEAPKNQAIFVTALEIGKEIKKYEKSSNLTTKKYASEIGPILCKDQKSNFTDQQVNILVRLIEEFDPKNYA